MGKNNAPVLDPIAWYGGNSGVDLDLAEGRDSTRWADKQYPHTKAGTRIVALKAPNEWGLYDMLGNVWELTQDTYQPYPVEAQMDPVVLGGSDHVGRGGAWDKDAAEIRAANRFLFSENDIGDYLGFRFVVDG